ncbi:MAG: protein kinase [Lentisphaeria bacterium]|jgi:CheY-like chemotaxis protein|nr:protein kinase [Lentisphaeria bacterium]MDP7741846.1 protein kinase [Lentisphaeria bacterium]
MTDNGPENKCVLVVDDEASIRRLVSRLLTKNSYDVIDTADGNEALKILDTGNVDLVISDIAMPNKSGLELLAEIKAHSDVPVIMLTGQSSVKSAVDCMKYGAFEYVMKPFVINELLEKIDKALPSATVADRTACLNHADNRQIAGYEIVRTLGEGNMGTVYLVHGNEKQCAGEKLAVKILKAGAIAEWDRDLCLKRFMNEAKAVSAVTHPNIVSIVEYGVCESGKIPFIAMEYIRGKSLKEYITDKDELTTVQKALILRQIADALSAIHERKICHRDIKPANIMVDQALTVKLTDFGIAHLPDSDLTMTANILGTPTYMSPEAFISAKVDERSDIFSLGTVAYEFLLGRKPFQSDNIRALARVIQFSKPQAPCKINPNFPRKLQQILAKMLKKDPANRYRSATEVVTEIDEYLLSATNGAGSVLQRLISRFSVSDWG